MQHKQNIEKQREQSKQAQADHEKRKETFADVAAQKKRKKVIALTLVAIIAIALLSWAGLAMFGPGPYDEFAKCLTEAGAVMQGEDWCPYTSGQKAMFGKSFKYIDYQINPGLTMRPTWVIDGESYETVQSFERLGALTGCEI